MAKPKALIISGPMDAKHVGGINVTAGKGSSVLDSYFGKAPIEPDEIPSHTYVAKGNIEVPKRSDTIAGTIRRPSLSLKSSLSKLRRKSISHMAEVHITTGTDGKRTMPMARSESVNTKLGARPLRAQSSLSRLRQRVGLDKELYESAAVPKEVAAEPETAPEPIEKDYPPLRARKPLSRATSHTHPRRTGPERPIQSTIVQRKPSSAQRDTTTIQHRAPPVSHQPAVVASTSTRPVRSKRADSGTAIALDKIPAQERPLPFQQIMAVRDFGERMAMYKRTREYWAYADHGLIEWTGRASGPKRAHHT